MRPSRRAALCTIAVAVTMAAVVLAAGCSKAAQVSEDDAVLAAKQFVSERVKFFSKNGSSTVDVADYRFDNVTTVDEGKELAVTMTVAAALGNETKNNTLTVKIDKRTGRVVEFNRKRLPAPDK